MEPIEFQEIKNVKIDNLKNNELIISADIILLKEILVILNLFPQSSKNIIQEQ